MLIFKNWRKKSQARKLYQQLKGHFDGDFYNMQNPDVRAANVDPLAHYIEYGWKEGRDPSPDFSTRLYLKENPDVHAENVNPLWHYVRYGKAQEHIPAPLVEEQDDRSVIESEFDAEHYQFSFHETSTPDDPLDHFLKQGWKDGKDPNSWFSTQYYLEHNPDVKAAGINPFVYYLRTGRRETRDALPPAMPKTVYSEQDKATQPGRYFEKFDPNIGLNRQPLAKVLAYYLPQFHSIPENDEFWGEGFTEWRNVARGQPRFEGHIQPRIPRDLGFYDLDDPEVMRRQINLAKAAGLHGFCFYYYWFGGKRVLEKPIEHILADPTLDVPFTLMWANENWTRTWDGMEKEVLLQQDYDPEKDAGLVDDLARHFQDPRYIRIEDRPLFFIYRPGQIPDAASTILKWRRLFESRHQMSPLILMAQGFGDTEPGLYGLDGAIEFPPHKICAGLDNRVDTVRLLDEEFSGQILNYDEVVDRARSEPTPEFPLIRTTTPYWDNEARRPGRGMAMNGSTPSKFGGWVRQAIAFARNNPVHGEAIVAVNAWNEWAEGAYLEPDTHYGAAYLNALSREVYGVRKLKKGSPYKLILVGHDAHRHGAQILVVNLALTMIRQFGVEVVILLCGPGPMIEEYEAICETHILPDDPAMTQNLIEDLAARGFSQAIVNSTASGSVTPILKNSAFYVTNLIHELGRLIREYNLTEVASSIASHSDRIVFPAAAVRDNFLEVAGGAADNVDIRPQGLYKSDLLSMQRQDEGIRAELGLPEDAKIVINVGYADLRKGFDQFIATAQLLCETHDDVWFVWIGNLAGEMDLWFMPEVQASEHADRFRFVDHTDNVERWYAAADVFFLSAREDPFPSVVLEALAVGLPIVGFAGTGGCDELISQHGTLVAKADHSAAARAISALVKQATSAREAAVLKRKDEITQNYLFDSYAHELLVAGDDASPGRVSVIVPNYNYAHCLEDRLRTIFNQSYPVFEIIVLDDASSDDSVAVIERIASTCNRQIKLLVNEENSGSPFKQWRRGLEQARGDYIWIAEADDIADPEFLRTLVATMQGADADLGFSDSWQINQDGEKIGDSYKSYANAIRGAGFDESFNTNGRRILEQYLAVKNIILNVSSVIFRKTALEAAMARSKDVLDEMRVAGDWRIYSEICAADGKVVYEAQALNGHRRHDNSVTHALDAEHHLAEIAEMQAFVNAFVTVDKNTVAAQQEHLTDSLSHIEGSQP